MTEEEMHESEALWPKTWKELQAYCENLIKNENDDYGKAVYCISLAATAMFHFAASEVGATGFQAGCADLDFLRRTMGLEHGFAIIDYSRALYPQCLEGEDNKALRAIFLDIAPGLAAEAKKLLKSSPTAHPNVRKHWEYVASFAPPKDKKSQHD